MHRNNFAHPNSNREPRDARMIAVIAEKFSTVTAVADALTKRDIHTVERAVKAAVALGPAGDTLLSHALTTAKGYIRVSIVVALGETTGPAGLTALRHAQTVTGPGSRDLRCAAVLALAKRCGAEATPDLLTALADRDGDVRRYAVIALAGAGDDRAWDQTLTWLTTYLKRVHRPATEPSPFGMAVAYLAQHAPAASERLAKLVTTIRTAWTRLDVDERQWLTGLWPAAEPTGPALELVIPPDPDQLRAWARHPLFEDLLSLRRPNTPRRIQRIRSRGSSVTRDG